MVTTLAPHPAVRRRLAERAPTAHDHDILLRPLGALADPIVAATEQNFLAAVLADLGKPSWREAIAARRAIRRGPDGVLELAQAVHRRFQLVLYEVVCRRPGSPRLDPAKLDSMGLVLRRQAASAWQGWISEGARLRGWLDLPQGDAEPASARRAARRADAAGAIQSLVARRRDPAMLDEAVLPLFAAPEALCAARGRTILYGIVPLTSAERSEAPLIAPDYGADRTELLRHLSGYLKARPATALPRAGQRLDPSWRPLDLPTSASGDDGKLRSLGLLLQQLLIEFDAFGAGGPARDLMRLLRGIMLPLARDDRGRVTASVDAATFTAAAAPILIAGAANVQGIVMPLEWPAIDAALGAQLTAASMSCLAERFAAITPQSPKFAGDRERYAVRAFVRTSAPPGCPPRLVWSGYSEPFRILPWWDGDGPGTQIALPPLDQLKRIKPNIAFQLPPSLANLLQGDMKKLKEGDDPGGPSFDIFWLCSFSIPAITICAFIVLNIFLSLFNIIFGWLAFIKLCIPIPRPK